MVLKRSLQLTFFIGIIIFALWLGMVAEENDVITEIVITYGYTGIFFASVVSGFNILVPIPIIAFLPLFVISGLDQWIVVILIISGVTIADMLVYYFGRIGKKIASVSLRKKTDKLSKFLEEHQKISLVALFLFAAFVPLPNEVLVIPMAFLGYSFFSIATPVFLGNAVFNILAMLGVVNIFELL